ncbi:MAG: hypothetical protein LBK13_07965 [Spirochaetales bacterium]|jgi:hypothetical protein|nr:hypothetical protein [Spirochaetales bacterium]
MKKNCTVFFTVITVLIVLCAFWGCDSGGDDDSGSPPGSVGSAADLAKIGTPGYPLNGNYELTADITLPAGWTPIGSGTAPFTGTFDGKGHSIMIGSTTASSIVAKGFSSGVDISSAPNLDFLSAWGCTGGFIARGLFAYIVDATIKNLNITISPGFSFEISSTVDQLQLFGIVAAAAVNTAFTNIHISGGTLDVDAPSTDRLLQGGVAGLLLEGSSMTDCHVEVKLQTSFVSTDSIALGGVVGSIDESGSITDCSMDGDVEVSLGTAVANETNNNIGGLVGDDRGGSITGCSMTGNMEVSGGDKNRIGGLAGHTKGSIANSFVSGNIDASSAVSGSDMRLGGLAGELEGDNGLAVIRKSYSTGTVRAADDAAAGGIAGISKDDIEITDCYASGVISAGSASNAGSIVGGAEVKPGGSGSITGCAALSVSVSCTGGTAKRIVGFISGGGSFSLNNNIANVGMLVNSGTVSSNDAADQNGEDKTGPQLADKATYIALGWDFADVWKWKTDESRPILKWQ